MNCRGKLLPLNLLPTKLSVLLTVLYSCSTLSRIGSNTGSSTNGFSFAPSFDEIFCIIATDFSLEDTALFLLNTFLCGCDFLMCFLNTYTFCFFGACIFFGCSLPENKYSVETQTDYYDKNATKGYMLKFCEQYSTRKFTYKEERLVLERQSKVFVHSWNATVTIVYIFLSLFQVFCK